jgi:hypothetical protein
MEVPFRACGLENFLGINAHSLENQASSFMSAMFRSRCVFSMTFAASATRMLDARCVPAVTIEA